MWNGYCQFGVVEKTFSQTDRHTRCRSQIPNSLIHTRRLQCMHGFFLSSEIRWRQTRYIKKHHHIACWWKQRMKEWKREKNSSNNNNNKPNFPTSPHRHNSIHFICSLHCCDCYSTRRDWIVLWTHTHSLIHSHNQ